MSLPTSDTERRSRLRALLLTVVGAVWIVLGIALSVVGMTMPLGAVVLVAGATLLVLRSLGGRVPEWVALTALGAATLVLPVIGPIAADGAGAGAFFVGVLSLLVVATAPRRQLWLALVIPVVVLAATWLATSAAAGLTGPTALQWQGVLTSAAALIAATFVAIVIMLQLSNASVADLVATGARADQLAEELREQNRELGRSLAERSAALAEVVRQRDELAADLREASSVDPASGLPNQRRWESQLPVMVAQAREKSMLLCVAVIDLDYFSEINLRHGHLVGDEVIRRVARRLHDLAAPGSLVSRIGGEEFALAVPGIDQRLAVDRLRLLQAAVSAESWDEVAGGLAPTFSAGIVEVDPDAVGDVSSVARRAVHRADLAMQRAKREGRNRIVAGEPL